MHTRTAGTSNGNQHLRIQTTCGRQISVGLLVLGDICHPVQRVSLDISPAPNTGDGTWAGLTAGEAEKLAAALLTQAAAAERAARNGRPAAASK
jgi:hypothetical protein